MDITVRLDSVPTEVLLGELKNRMGRLEIKRDLIQEDLNAKNKSVADLRRASATSSNQPGLPPKSDAEFTTNVEDDEDEDESSEQVLDLFSNERCSGGPDEVIQRAKNVYGFDVVAFVKSRIEKDDLAMARLVNFIRTRIASGDSPSTVIQNVNDNVNNWQEDDQYLTPFLGGNDPMLWWGDAFSEPDDGELDSQFDDDDEEDLEEEDEMKEPNQRNQQTIANKEEEQEGELVEDDYYFDSYGRIDIHEEMLRDTVRTNSYLKSFQQATRQSIFTDEKNTIMDVGAGTGVLSMLAIREGGVKKVFCVEASKNTSKLCQALLRTNGFDNQCQVIGEKVESVVLTRRSDIRVDAIISEWMGYALLYESMLESVLVARDAFLKPNGRLFPNRARVLLEAVKDDQGRLKFWDNVYGLNFSPARRVRIAQADVIQLGKQSKVSNRVVLKDFDLERMKMDDMDLDEPFCLITGDSRVDGICISFDCFFPTDDQSGMPSLSTTLDDEPTHWHQTVLWLDRAMEGLSVGTEIKGSLSFTRRVSTNRREYDLLLKITSPVEMIKIYGMS